MEFKNIHPQENSEKNVEKTQDNNLSIQSVHTNMYKIIV